MIMDWTIQDTSVILVGLAIVFVGLVCIILLCKIMSAACNVSKKVAAPAPVSPNTSTPVSQAEAIPNRAELIAAVSAVIAEEIGEDVSNIRILSLKKI